MARFDMGLIICNKRKLCGNKKDGCYHAIPHEYDDPFCDDTACPHINIPKGIKVKCIRFRSRK
jgi:hypothetical protein